MDPEGGRELCSSIYNLLVGQKVDIKMLNGKVIK
jgi:hypothetical protein